MKFSQRIGKTEMRTVLQKESVDEIFKVKLWNVFMIIFFGFMKKRTQYI